MTTTTTQNLFCCALIGILMLVFQGCDPAVNYDKVIVNDSGYDLRVTVDELSEFTDFTDSTFFIPKDSSLAIYQLRYIGTIEGYRNCDIPEERLSIEVVQPDSLTVTADINDATLWEYFVTDKTSFGGGSCFCRLRITEDMVK